jgi:hypothetical protein
MNLVGVNIRGSSVSVNKGRNDPLIIVTIADSIVKLIITHSPILVNLGNCNFQNARTGMTARTMSVIVVYAQSQ